jgi:cell division protease FtsH
MRLPERDRLSVSVEKLEADLAVAMGGRVAEEMIFGEMKVTTGAQSDISMATNLAENMVTRWGMSPKLGPIDYSDEEGQFITKDKVSADTKKIIDSEIKRLVTEGHSRAAKILTENRKDLEIVAQALLEYETLSGDEIRDLLQGKKPVRASLTEEAPVRKSALPSGGVVKDIKNKDDRPNA